MKAENENGMKISKMKNNNENNEKKAIKYQRKWRKYENGMKIWWKGGEEMAKIIEEKIMKIWKSKANIEISMKANNRRK